MMKATLASICTSDLHIKHGVHRCNIFLLFCTADDYLPLKAYKAHLFKVHRKD